MFQYYILNKEIDKKYTLKVTKIKFFNIYFARLYLHKNCIYEVRSGSLSEIKKRLQKDINLNTFDLF